MVVPSRAKPKPRKSKRKWRRDSVKTVVRELFSADALKNASTPALLKQLGDELDRRGIIASPDTQRRALGRR
jgi:hypothetical protein